jgi:3'(2'), 5'-bisphosphate nucleotidase
VARRAGARIIEVYEGDYEVHQKSDSTPLTTADLAANELIVRELQQMPFSAPILTEESANIPYEERCQWTRYWLVDPLDGTREFIRRSDEFSVNIALIELGEPVIGVVYAPVLQVGYYAARGFGAWKQIDGERPKRINVRNAVPRGNVTVARSNSHLCPEMESFLKKLGDHQEVSMGAALKSCLVAEGRADVYARLGPTSEWDTGAAQCIVEEAGGMIVDTRMQELRYNTKDSLLNPHFFVIGDADHDWPNYL